MENKKQEEQTENKPQIIELNLNKLKITWNANGLITSIQR